MNFPPRAGRVSGRATPSLRHAPRAKLQRTDPGSSPLNLRGILFKRSGPALITQSLLIDFMNEHPDQCADWNVVFSDRGHFTEPHTGHVVGLGTLAVRNYIESYANPALTEGG